MSRNIISNFIYSMFDKFARMAISFVIVALMARSLSKSDFGILNYSLTVSSLLITATWIISADLIVKILAEKKYSESVVVNTSFWGRLFASLIFTALYAIYAFVNYSGSDLYVLLIFASSILLNPFSVIHSYFRYRTQLQSIIKLDLLSYIITSSLKIGAVLIYNNVVILAIVYSLEYIFSALIFLYLYRKESSRIGFSFDNALFKEMVRLGLPILLGTSVNVLFLKVDRLMITSFLGTEKLAEYYVATNLTEVWWSIPIIFIQIASSKMLYQVDEIKENYRDINKALSVFFCLLCGFLYLISEELIVFVYGNDYLASSLILKVYIISSIFVFWDYVNVQVLIKYNKTRLILWKSIAGLILNVVLNYFLIQNYGLIGAALGTLLSYFGSWLFVMIFDNVMRKYCIKQVECLFFPFFNPINFTEKLKRL